MLAAIEEHGRTARAVFRIDDLPGRHDGEERFDGRRRIGGARLHRLHIRRIEEEVAERVVARFELPRRAVAPSRPGSTRRARCFAHRCVAGVRCVRGCVRRAARARRSCRPPGRRTAPSRSPGRCRTAPAPRPGRCARSWLDHAGSGLGSSPRQPPRPTGPPHEVVRRPPARGPGRVRARRPRGGRAPPAVRAALRAGPGGGPGGRRGCVVRPSGPRASGASWWRA